MKKLFKYTYLALVGMVATLVASCSDSYKYDGRGSWDAADGYANIYFETTDEAIELDPAEPTTYTVKVSRRNTQGALTVPFEIQENTDDVFTVGQAVFADGEAETTFTLTFPKAEVGKPYTLKILTSDPSLVSKYSAGVIYTFEVTRVKWNDVGFYYKDAAKTDKVEGYAMYTDDLMTFYTGAAPLVYPVKLQERDDQKGVFRMVNAYGEDYPYNDPGDWDASKDYYIIINATDPEKVYISPSAVDMGLAWSYGEFYTLNLAGNYVELAEASTDAAKQKEYLDKAEPYYGKYENGKITFPANSFYMAMAGLYDGDWSWYGNASGAFSLVINPDLDLHNADMTSDEDFKWELVNDKYMLASAKLGEDIENVALYKGTCINTEGKCDERFAKEYGTAYKIASPYADGYDIYFAVNDKGEVTLPDDLKYQNTGMKAVGDEVYAVISPAASTFTESVITLKIAFQTKPDDDGNFIEYGATEEVLQFITWTKVGTGMYTYTAYFTDYDEETDTDNPVTDGPYDILQRDDKPNTFKLTEWGYGGEFVFTWDEKTNKCTVPISFTGYVSPTNGNMYVSDMVYLYNFFGYDQSYDKFPCTFDPETNTFTFNVAVFSKDTGSFWNGEETLVATWDVAASRKAASTKNKTLKQTSAKAQKMKSNSNYSRLGKGTKTNVKSKKTIKAETLVK